jgi:hypothetical protein
MFYDVNPFIGMHRTVREQLTEMELRSTRMEVLVSPELRLVMEQGADRRQENLPTASEVADSSRSDYASP